MGSPTQIKSLFWLSYFIAWILLLGVIVGFMTVTPLYWIARIFPPARALADRALQRGVQGMMAVQPWFSAKIDLPERPGRVLIVSNHRSHLDAFILLSRVPGVRIMAKQSLFAVPFLGTMMRVMEQIPVKGQLEGYFSAMEIARKKLKDGGTVHVFPELTRCAPGFKGVKNFSLLPFQVAIQEKVSVLPVAFKGTDSVWGKGMKGIMSGRPIEARALEIIDSSRYQTAQDLKNAVQERIERAIL